MKEEKALLESILVAQVLILEKQIAAEQKAKGVSRFGDYSREAVKLLHERQPQVLELLRQSLG
jgi:hypothetical protein